MATAIHPFDKVQAGIESVKGTALAATRVLVGEGVYFEEQDMYRAAYPRGYRATPGGAGTILQKRARLEMNADLSAEQILWPLLTGIKGAVTPSASASLQTWVFTPQLTTSVITLDTATIEYMQGDGTTNHFYGESAYCFTTGFKISSAFGNVPKLSWTMAGRARQTDTPTAALVPYTTLEELTHPLLKVYNDTTWAGLGGTQLATIVRSANFECMTGVMPDYTADGRADKDMTKHSVGSLGGKLSLVLEMDSVGAAQFTNFRSNALQYIRLIWTGRTISAGVSTVQIDGAYRFVSDPKRSSDGEQNIVTAELEAVEDDTSTKILEFTAKNALAAVT